MAKTSSGATTVAPRITRAAQPPADSALPRVGPLDDASIEYVMELLPGLPFWEDDHREHGPRRRGARTIMEWLLRFPGAGWQQRWLNSGADDGVAWIEQITADDPRSRASAREEIHRGLYCLLALRLNLPSYGFIAANRPLALYTNIQATISPDAFGRAEKAAAVLGITTRHRIEAILILTKVVLHTGRRLDQLTEADVVGFRDWFRARDGRTKFGLHGAWDMLVAIGVLPVGSSLSNTVRQGQRPTAELVDRHRIASQPVRALLIRYLDERRPSLDYGPFLTLVAILAGTFWADLQAHHPGLNTIDLPREVATAWKQRLRVIVGRDGVARERKNYLDVLIRVRSFYLDLQEWALQDPSWAPWAVASPITKSDTAGLLKARRKVIAEMHQRVRERLPHLPILVDTADQYRCEQAALLDAANATPVGELFTHDGRQYRRTVHKSYTRGWARTQPPTTVVVEEVPTATVIDQTKVESDAFWAWAAIEVLRHTGVFSGGRPLPRRSDPRVCAAQRLIRRMLAAATGVGQASPQACCGTAFGS
jgi:hypothetical protein